jgi:hypothetical protein
MKWTKIPLMVHGDIAIMVKDDMKDQIPLFELPTAEKPEDSSRPGTAGAGKTGTEKSYPGEKAATKKSRPSPSLRDTKKLGSSAGKGRHLKAAPGPVPEGDVRLTANIREDLHLKLKIVAATRRTTIGELIEELVEHYLQ